MARKITIQMSLWVTDTRGNEHEIGSGVVSDLILGELNNDKLNLNLSKLLNVEFEATLEWHAARIPVEWRLPENDPYLS